MIADTKPAKVRHALRGLREKCESLADAPRGYPLIQRTNTRAFAASFGSYLHFE